MDRRTFLSRTLAVGAARIAVPALILAAPSVADHRARCGGHQGRRIADGRRPAGTRYCDNGLALRFVPAGAPLPALRS